MGFPGGLYRTFFVPSVLVSLVTYVIMLCVLESGRDAGQRISFIVVASVLLAVQILWSLYQLYRVQTYGRRLEDHITGLQALDSWFGLLLAFAMMLQSFYVLDTSGGRDYYWKHPDLLSNPEHNWVTALDFVFNTAHIATATFLIELEAHQFWPRFIIFLSELSFVGYLVLVLPLVFLDLFEAQRELRKSRSKKHEHPEQHYSVPVPGYPPQYQQQQHPYAPMIMQQMLPAHLRDQV